MQTNQVTVSREYLNVSDVRVGALKTTFDSYAIFRLILKELQDFKGRCDGVHSNLLSIFEEDCSLNSTTQIMLEWICHYSSVWHIYLKRNCQGVVAYDVVIYRCHCARCD